EQWTQSGTVRYTSVTNGYRCARNDYNDQTNVFSGNYTSSNRPNVKLALVPYQTGPEIAVSPASLGFGEVEVGTSSTLQFSISNSGGSLLSGTITTPAGYTVSGSAARTAFRAGKDAVHDSGNVERNILSFSIPAGSSTAFDLTFAPTSAQIYSGNVVINSNDSDESNIQIPVTGTGIISLSTPVLSINRVDGATQLSWNVIPNATGYKVFSASDPYGDYELLTLTPIITNTYTDNRALPRAFYKVVAVRN
ncbi:MAG: choice-of-anchor D domain-containing protein, partial [Candidatus Cloacimonetes bacterium]|nr:choice-of-anchor D domain-containing protein [Candidatus Cloacimonadota bacterium]